MSAAVDDEADDSTQASAGSVESVAVVAAARDRSTVCAAGRPHWLLYKIGRPR
jgi:hypothetical protein